MSAGERRGPLSAIYPALLVGVGGYLVYAGMASDFFPAYVFGAIAMQDHMRSCLKPKVGFWIRQVPQGKRSKTP